VWRSHTSYGTDLTADLIGPRPTGASAANLKLMPFNGLRVLSFESRRSAEIAELIRRQGGDPFVAPSMREAPIENNPEAFAFAERLFGGGFDMMIFLTGVGTRALDKVLASRYQPEKFAEALRKITVVARGPKPVAALREMQVLVTVAVPEPNTWRELLSATANRPERHIAVQEYGKSNPDLLSGLQARGADVTPVRVYEWDLPEDTGPLREGIRRIVEGQADVAIFTTSIQLTHLFRIAAEVGLEGALLGALRRMVIASIGPTTSEALEEFGLTAEIVPSHPKMGFLVKETAEQASAMLERKRATHA
jgi:uroporphyrinogen-III synthase